MTEKTYIRNSIGNHMVELGRKDDRVVIVNADLMKTSRNQSFVQEYPNRSFNVGIAEQNLVSFSAGLSHEGFKPYVFSMAPFLSMRACEQCRTDIAYGNFDVCLVGSYSGCSGGISGATHWGLEDYSILSSFPNMTILEPSCTKMAISLLNKTLSFNGPLYIRVTVEPTEDLYSFDAEYEIGGYKVAREGSDGAYICSGVLVEKALLAAEEIEKKYNKKIKVIDLYTIKPINQQAITEAVNTGHVIIAQDHFVVGGLGEKICAQIALLGTNCKVKVLGVNDEFTTMAHADALYKKYLLDVEGLEYTMLSIL